MISTKIVRICTARQWDGKQQFGKKTFTILYRSSPARAWSISKHRSILSGFANEYMKMARAYVAGTVPLHGLAQGRCDSTERVDQKTEGFGKHQIAQKLSVEL
jgi:hypothetical protein